MATGKIWLITGASSGLGLSIALSALKAGHKVVACARTPDKAATDHPEVEALGGRWIILDVTKTDTQQVVEKTIQREGHIDVVVNNAGYALQGTVDDMSEDEMQEQLNVTFFGAIRVIKAVLPSMRARKSGAIVNMSSIFGFVAPPECQMYSAAKYALESVSESYASLLAPFNIRVVILEPGVFKSNLAKASRKPSTGISEDYQQRMGPWLEFVNVVATMPNTARGDPAKLGERTVEFVDKTGMAKDVPSSVLRLILGFDALDAWGARLESLKENYAAMQEIAISTDFDKAG